MNEYPVVEEVREIWAQDSDSCSDADTGQSIEVKTQDAGGGAFIVIKTDRWAIDADQIDAFCEALKRVCDMVGDGNGRAYGDEVQVRP